MYYYKTFFKTESVPDVPDDVKKKCIASNSALSFRTQNILTKLLNLGYFVTDITDVEAEKISYALNIEPENIEVALMAINKNMSFDTFLGKHYSPRVAIEIFYGQCHGIDLTPFVQYGEKFLFVIRQHYKNLGANHLDDTNDFSIKNFYKMLKKLNVSRKALSELLYWYIECSKADDMAKFKKLLDVCKRIEIEWVNEDYIDDAMKGIELGVRFPKKIESSWDMRKLIETKKSS